MTQRKNGVPGWSTKAALAAALVAASAASHAGVLATAPDFSGTYFADSPYNSSDSTYSETVATFDWSPASVPAKDVLVISGDWGIAQPDGYTYGTANSSLYANGILVATCHSYDACWSGPSLVDWSFAFTADQAAAFDGHITLVAAANPDEGGFYYGSNQLSRLQISAVPEPAPIMTMVGALSVFALMSRRRRTRG
jgi:uncharacterized protein (TIGR03382 family)